MQAMILAAGLGTRLRPLTHQIPKALIPVKQKDGKEIPALEGLLDKMVEQGFTKIIINIHHLPGQIRAFVSDYLEERNLPPVTICFSDESKEILGTGGALKHACALFDSTEPVLVHNVDILSDIYLPDLMKELRSEDLAALLVTPRESSRQLLFDTEWRLSGWRNKTLGETRMIQEGTGQGTGEQDSMERAFSGIYVLPPQAIELLSTRKDRVFSIIDFFLEQAPHHTVRGVELPTIQVLDIGKPDTYRKTLS